jgi:hypothetical protein
VSEKYLNDQSPIWYDQLPFVDHFFTFEGMLNYSKLYLPNIYDRLCSLKKGPILQESINHYFGPNQPVDGYLVHKQFTLPDRIGEALSRRYS